jgi:hypothetical protein
MLVSLRRQLGGERSAARERCGSMPPDAAGRAREGTANATPICGVVVAFLLQNPNKSGLATAGTLSIRRYALRDIARYWGNS